MKTPITALAVALLFLLMVGCGAGGSTRSHTQGPTSTQSSTIRDIPQDTITEVTRSGLMYDPDDDPVRFYGREAVGVERQAIMTLVRRYYAAVAKLDGGKTCRMMLPSTIREVVRADSQTAHSKRCSKVASFEFRQRREELRLDLATLEFISIRVKGATGIVLLRFNRATDPNPLSIQRERSVWKVAQLLATIHMV
jgi:hypothetical protein